MMQIIAIFFGKRPFSGKINGTNILKPTEKQAFGKIRRAFFTFFKILFEYNLQI